MKANLQQLLGIASDRVIHVFGSSPSAALGIPLVQKGDIVIGLNDSPIRLISHVQTDYWVSANDAFPVPFFTQHTELINLVHPKAFVFSDSALYARKWQIPRDLDFYLTCDWIPFDQRHFGASPCMPEQPCCSLLQGQNLSPNIQDLICSVFQVPFRYSTGNTVAVHALALALLMRPVAINIHGVDLNASPSSYQYFASDLADSIIYPPTKYWDVQPHPISLRSRIFSKLKSNPIFTNRVSKPDTGIFDSHTFDAYFFSIESRNTNISDFTYMADIASSNHILLSTSNPTSLLASIPYISVMQPLQ